MLGHCARFTHLISSQLTSFNLNLNWVTVSALWSDLVCHGCDQSQWTRSHFLAWLVTAVVNWVTLHCTHCHSVQMRWGQMQRDVWCECSFNLSNLTRCCDGDSVDAATVREIVGALLLRHICQLVSNAHAITGIVRSSSRPTVDSVDSADPTRVLSSGQPFTGRASDEGTSTAVDESQQVRLATAIYPTASLMNHSCDPSIISRCQLLLIRLTHCKCKSIMKQSSCLSSVWLSSVCLTSDLEN